MRKVYVVGMGQTPVAEHWNRTAAALATEALAQAVGPIAPERLGALYVANALGGALGVQTHLGLRQSMTVNDNDSPYRTARAYRFLFFVAALCT